MDTIRSQAWCNGDNFKSFWQHYDAAEHWRRSHDELVRQACRPTSARRPARRVCSEVPSVSTEHVKVVEQAVEEPNQVVDDEAMDVSNDQYELFKQQTLEHQRQRDAKKREIENKKKDSSHWIVIEDQEYIYADKMGVYAPSTQTTEAPDEQSKTEKRRADAKRLYGENSTKILAMETALDVRFDEECRRKQIPYWPIIPLNLANLRNS